MTRIVRRDEDGFEYQNITVFADHFDASIVEETVLTFNETSMVVFGLAKFIELSFVDEYDDDYDDEYEESLVAPAPNSFDYDDYDDIPF